MKFLSIDELKKLDISEASAYCNLLREYITENVLLSGGHLASNLGISEISVALIRSFNSPDDKIIYDVGHQSYVHKLLTGRCFNSENLRTFEGFSGFTKRDESPHDPFGAGHSSTALSSALGFARAARYKGDSSYAVAVIGDGAFCTGMTFEALNNISRDDRLIIVLNDNEMSISKNVGTMSEYLNRMRITKRYLTFKRKTKSAFQDIPFLYKTASAFKRTVKRLLIKPNFFEDLGIAYIGPADGNDLNTVETLIAEAKSRNTPVLLHLITKKGKGIKEAEDNPGKFHFVSPSSSDAPTFSSKYTELLSDYSKTNVNAVAITAAMCDGTGLWRYREQFPDRLFDVGISEEHAATFAAALAASGLLPFYTVYSTFFQRSYDQVIHDISLQKLKVVIALDRAGLVGQDGPTHHGVFDVSMMLNVPSSVIYSPSTFDELEYSFNKCVEYDGLSVLRYPKAENSDLLTKYYPIASDFTYDSPDKCDVVIVTYGRVTEEALKAKLLLKSKGISATVLKFLKLKPIDSDYHNKKINDIAPKLVCVVEEGMKIGGFGEYFLSGIDAPVCKKVIAIDELFVPQGTISELLEYCSLSAASICSRILEWL